MFTSIEIHNETGAPPHISIKDAQFIPTVGEVISTAEGRFLVKSREFAYTTKTEGEHHAVVLNVVKAESQAASVDNLATWRKLGGGE